MRHFGLGSNLKFGTGGVRGLTGPGPDKINCGTISLVVRGLIEYLRRPGVLRGNPEGCIPVAFDTRASSEILAAAAVTTLKEQGFNAAMFNHPVPTPALSLSVRRLCAPLGIMITASHNPPVYNGIKIYWADGGQLLPEQDRQIMKCIRDLAPLPLEDFRLDSDSACRGFDFRLPETLFDEYLKALVDSIPGFSSHDPLPLKGVELAYSPLQGAGIFTVRRVLESLGAIVHVPPLEDRTDGLFSAIESPNPEDPGAMTRVVELAETRGLNLAMASDPDCDRLGVVFLDSSGVFRATGHDLAVLLLDLLLDLGGWKDWPDPFVVTSVVTTDLFEALARRAGVDCRRILTGFKYIGQEMERASSTGQGNFLFGAEESLGYLAGSEIRDKDGTQAALLAALLMSRCGKRNQTPRQRLREIHDQLGCHRERLATFATPPAGDSEAPGEALPAVRKAMEELVCGTMTGAERLVALGKGLIPSCVEVFDFNTSRQWGPGFAPRKVESTFPSSSMVMLRGEGWKIYLRPSGTEPKIKAYLMSRQISRMESPESVDQRLQALGNALGAYIESFKGSGSERVLLGISETEVQTAQ